MPTIINKANGYSEYSFHSVAHFFKWHSTFNYRWSSPISGMVFRGHSLSSYELIPSAHRMDSQTNMPKILNYVSNPYTFPAHLSEYNLVEAEYETEDEDDVHTWSNMPEAIKDKILQTLG